jgi:hypothetical protein
VPHTKWVQVGQCEAESWIVKKIRDRTANFMQVIASWLVINCNFSIMGLARMDTSSTLWKLTRLKIDWMHCNIAHKDVCVVVCIHSSRSLDHSIYRLQLAWFTIILNSSTTERYHSMRSGFFPLFSGVQFVSSIYRSRCLLVVNNIWVKLACEEFSCKFLRFRKIFLMIILEQCNSQLPSWFFLLEGFQFLTNQSFQNFGLAEH